MEPIQPFHQRFNIRVDFDEAKKRFVNRAYNLIFGKLFREISNDDSRKEEMYLARERIATALGMRAEYDSFEEYIGNDFLKCLRSIEALYQGFVEDKLNITMFDEYVQQMFSPSEHDLGIEWRDGHFVPSGAKLLDDALVNESLKWLEDSDLKNILDPFSKGLLHHSESIKNPAKLKDVITDMHEALEATAKWITKTNTDLSSNTVKLIDDLGLSKEHKDMLKAYTTYANKYFRHAQNPEDPSISISPSEAENFIYMTGLFIRFAIQKIKEKI